MTQFCYEDMIPCVHETAYIAPTGIVIGRAFLASDSSVWFHAVLRADNEEIHVGRGSNVQEGAVLHTDPGFPLTVGENVTVGHQAMLHGCSIGDGSLIGIKAVILNGATIGKNCLVGAGALVTEGKSFPDNALIMGAPAKVSRMLSEEEINRMHRGTDEYVNRSRRYRLGLRPSDAAVESKD